jgi:UDP-glucose 4-epimerase
MNRNIFLTGGAGFIGVKLTEELLKRSHRVTCFDNLSTGKFKDIERFVMAPGYQFIQGDILDPMHLVTTMKGHDVVWHLAANTIMQGQDNNFDFKHNTIGTLNVLEAMKDLSIKELLFSSTAATYGDEPNTILSEKHGPMLPISLYAASKLAAEAFISVYAHHYNIHAWIFRFGNVVGGGMGHGIIYDLIQKLKNRSKGSTPILEVWGDGQGRKPYFLVEDCIWGMITAFNIPPGERRQCDVYNLGTDGQTSVDDVAHIVCYEMQQAGKIPMDETIYLNHTGGRHGFPGDVPVVNYTATKMNSYGWRPSHSSDEAVHIAAQRLIPEAYVS